MTFSKSKACKLLVVLSAVLVGMLMGIAIAVSVTWLQEQPKLKPIQAKYLQAKSGITRYIAVPQLSELPPPIWVRSSIVSEDNKFTLTSPVFVLEDRQTYEVAVPSTLKGGVYTVSVVIGYKLNPLRYVEQSLVIALLIIDGGA